MTLRLIQGGGNPSGFEVPLHSIELVQLAHSPQKALIPPHQQRIDRLSADVLNVAYADALGLVSPEADVPDPSQRVEFIADTHQYAARLVMDTVLGTEFRLLSSVLNRRPVDWARLIGHRPAIVSPFQSVDMVVRDNRVRALSDAASHVLRLTKIEAPLRVPALHEPSLARRTAFVKFILKGSADLPYSKVRT